MQLFTPERDNSASTEPAHELFGQAASLLATARALEVAAQAPDTTTAVQPTLACLESSFEALADAAGHLAGQVRSDHADADGVRRTLRSEADHAFAQFAAVLTDARDACGAARVAAGAVVRGEPPR
jgi:hypothetical protein